MGRRQSLREKKENGREEVDMDEKKLLDIETIVSGTVAKY